MDMDNNPEMSRIIATVLPIFWALDEKRQQELVDHAQRLLDEAEKLYAAQLEERFPVDEHAANN